MGDDAGRACGCGASVGWGTAIPNWVRNEMIYWSWAPCCSRVAAGIGCGCVIGIEGPDIGADVFSSRPEPLGMLGGSSILGFASLIVASGLSRGMGSPPYSSSLSKGVHGLGGMATGGGCSAAMKGVSRWIRH